VAFAAVAEVRLKDAIKSIGRYAARATGLSSQIDQLGARLNEQTGALRRQLNKLDANFGRVDRGTQILLALKYRELADRDVRCSFADVEFRNYSQNGEDGILWYIFSTIGTRDKTCVEMCAGNGRECNTANLIVNHGWTGLLFDGDENNALSGKEFFGSHPDTLIYPPKFVHAWITAENADALATDNGRLGEVDLLSLDMDGVDYWIWDAISSTLPRVVIAEVQVMWGAETAVTVPYRSDFRAEFFDKYPIYGGASLPAFVKLAKQKGYRLIGCQRYGFNAVFLRNDLGRGLFPEVSAQDCLKHPICEWAYQVLRPMTLGKEWVEV
jgi:hypothetical protein